MSEPGYRSCLCPPQGSPWEICSGQVCEDARRGPAFECPQLKRAEAGSVGPGREEGGRVGDHSIRS